MSNLSIENISRVVQSGDTEKLFNRTSVEPVGVEGSVAEAGPANGAGGKSFGDLLKDSIDQTNLYQAQADTAMKEMVAGRNKNLHETMLTVERADASLKLMMQVRNKIIDAYKEIMRMQV
jgi:flagellar hook-basal body complex protein FliE